MKNKKDAPPFRELREALRAHSGVISIAGISESRSSAVAGVIAEERGGQTLIIVSGFGRAKRLAEDLAFFVDRKIYVIPEEERSLSHYDAKSHDGLEQRLRALAALSGGQDCIVVAPVSGALKKQIPRQAFCAYRQEFVTGREVDIEQAKNSLSAMGYERTGTVEVRGQYSVRGGILDIFPLDSDYPCRVEFFDTEVDAIRFFDPLTQRSIENTEHITIYPASQMIWEADAFARAAKIIEEKYDAYAEVQEKERREALAVQKGRILESLETRTNLQFLENYIHYFCEAPVYLWDYFLPGSTIVVEDPDRIGETLNLHERETGEAFTRRLERGEAVPEDLASMPCKEDFFRIYTGHPVCVLQPFAKRIPGAEQLDAALSVSSKQPPVFNGRMDFLESELKRYVKNRYSIQILCATEERRQNMTHFLRGIGLEGKVGLGTASLSSGVEFPDEKWIVFSDSDIFVNSKQRRKRKASKSGKPIKAFTDIRKGDYVVHENHGIGKFVGVEQLEVQGIRKDYLKIRYAGEDLLYVPVDQMDLVQKYVGAEGASPKINKLTGGEWKKTKERAKAAIQDMAKELLALSAQRQMEQGYAFGSDTVWQREFEDSFPYEETQDQLRCTAEIKKDMEKPAAMDRLLCGDVGYGKTEVAARAIFKCLAEGKQAAVLVPTTILANQHYLNFKERFSRFPFTVDVLCRFRNETEQAATLSRLQKGSVDLLVGTHRMLSKDVHFKDLGLLVIDEEQRFGVEHKEALKLLRKNVDVLTLSATPIPRTLHMSLVGIRDMSLIEEPPEERYPVQTYVLEQEDEILKEAIQRELDRDGQVFVVYNRVRGIQSTAERIRRLIPEASVIAAHGQMNEGQLEDIMLAFMDRQYDVLVATTIIESGIDIPNVNTIVILDADRFGLSQLYQLRGRVGRSNRIAYAYLMYQRDKVLSEQASKRLRAIREFTEFGSGFRIAMRDLEIRGAGNLLGTEQSGHMLTIGYELYCKLVDEAVRELAGEAQRDLPPPETEVSLEFNLEAYIPERYIEDELTKLQMYKKIAAIRDASDQEEIVDELIDRFGDVPKEAMNLIALARVRALAETHGILRIYPEQGKLVFEFDPKSGLHPEQLSALAAAYGKNLLIHGGARPFVKLGGIKNENWMKAAEELLTKLKG